jgi:hypothetical protein
VLTHALVAPHGALFHLHALCGEVPHSTDLMMLLRCHQLAVLDLRVLAVDLPRADQPGTWLLLRCGPHWVHCELAALTPAPSDAVSNAAARPGSPQAGAAAVDSAPLLQLLIPVYSPCITLALAVYEAPLLGRHGTPSVRAQLVFHLHGVLPLLRHRRSKALSL